MLKRLRDDFKEKNFIKMKITICEMCINDNNGDKTLLFFFAGIHSKCGGCKKNKDRPMTLENFVIDT